MTVGEHGSQAMVVVDLDQEGARCRGEASRVGRVDHVVSKAVDEDGRDVAALQEETLLGGIREYETEQDERASTAVAGGAVDEANFAEE